MGPPATSDKGLEPPNEETVRLWHELGSIYAAAGNVSRRAYMLAFASACVVGALVLISAPVIGTGWAGPFAAAVPVTAGLGAGLSLLTIRWTRFLRKRASLERVLTAHEVDVRRPARKGLAAYYDPQLILLRSEYEFLRQRGAHKSTRILEESFGFTPEDRFECGPLNIEPDTPEMHEVREGWERRIAARNALEMQMPELGLREDRAYRVFPREMTVPFELSTRAAYLAISATMLKKRYGRDPLRNRSMSAETRRRSARDLREYATLTRKIPRA